MAAIFAVVAGCGGPSDASMIDVCADLLGRTAVDPKGVQINESKVLSSELDRGEAEKELRELNDGKVSSLELSVLDGRYSDGTPSVVHYVSIDYTDKGRGLSRRGKAICKFYSDDRKTRLVAAELSGNRTISGMKQILDFTIIHGAPKKMGAFGELK